MNNIALFVSETVYKQNGEWKILELICDPPLPQSSEEHIFFFYNPSTFGGWCEVYNHKDYKLGSSTYSCKQFLHVKIGEGISPKEAFESYFKYKVIKSSSELG